MSAFFKLVSTVNGKCLNFLTISPFWNLVSIILFAIIIIVTNVYNNNNNEEIRVQIFSYKINYFLPTV